MYATTSVSFIGIKMLTTKYSILSLDRRLRTQPRPINAFHLPLCTSSLRLLDVDELRTKRSSSPAFVCAFASFLGLTGPFWRTQRALYSCQRERNSDWLGLHGQSHLSLPFHCLLSPVTHYIEYGIRIKAKPLEVFNRFSIVLKLTLLSSF